MEASALGLTKKNNDFSQSPESFCHAVRVLMHGYAIVSMEDPAGDEWRSLGAALQHVSTVESFSRANSKSAGSLHYRIMEAEAAVRSEWTKLGQTQQGISLTAIIDVVAQRHAIWPLLSEFTKHPARTQKGFHKGSFGNRWETPSWAGKGKGVFVIFEFFVGITGKGIVLNGLERAIYLGLVLLSQSVNVLFLGKTRLFPNAYTLTLPNVADCIGFRC